MSSDYSIFWMAAMVACFGVTLQTLWNCNSFEAFSKAKWLLWTVLTIACVGFWGPLPTIPAIIIGSSAITALYFEYHKNQLGTWLGALLGLITVLGTTVFELV